MAAPIFLVLMWRHVVTLNINWCMRCTCIVGNSALHVWYATICGRDVAWYCFMVGMFVIYASVAEHRTTQNGDVAVDRYSWDKSRPPKQRPGHTQTQSQPEIPGFTGQPDNTARRRTTELRDDVYRNYYRYVRIRPYCAGIVTNRDRMQTDHWTVSAWAATLIWSSSMSDVIQAPHMSWNLHSSGRKRAGVKLNARVRNKKAKRVADLLAANYLDMSR